MRNTQQTLGSGYATAVLTNKSMNKLQKAQAVMYKQVDENTRTKVLKTLGMTEDRISKINKQVASGNAIWARLGLSVKSFAVSVKTAMISLMSNPMMWIFAVVGAISHIIGRINEAKELKESLTEDMQRAGKEDSLAIEDIFKQNSALVKRKATGNEISVKGVRITEMSIEIDRDAIRWRGAREVLDELLKELQQYSPLYQGQFIDIMALEDDVDKVERAFKHLNDVQFVEKVMSASDAMQDVLADGPSWSNLGLTDTPIEDLKDYKDAVNDLASAMKKYANDNDIWYRLDQKYREYIQYVQDATGESRADAMLRNQLLLGGSKSSDTYTKYILDDLHKIQDREDVKNDAVAIAEQFKVEFTNQFGNDFDKCAIYFQNWLNKIFSEAKISDEMQKLDLTNIFLSAITNSMGNGDFQAAFIRMNLINHFNDLMKGELKSDTTEEEFEEMLQKFTEKTNEWGISQGYDMYDLGFIATNQYRKGAEAAWNEIKLTELWQQRAGDEFKVNTVMHNQIKLVSSKHELYEKVKANYKENKEFIEAEMNTLPKIKANLGLDIGIEMSTESLAKAIEVVKAKIASATTDAEKNKLLNILNNELTPIYNALASVDEDKAWAKKEGYDLEDKKKNKGNGSNKDKELDAWKKRFDDLKKFRTEYEKWLKVYGNSEAAFAKVKSIYKDLNIPAEAITSLHGYTSELTKLGEEVRRLQNKGNNPQGRKSLVNDIFVFRDSTVGMQDFKEESDRFLSRAQEIAKTRSQAWEIYKQVLDDTGDIALANHLSKLGNATGNGNLAEDLRYMVISKMAGLGLNADAFSFNANDSDKDIMDKVGGLVGSDGTSKQYENIAAIVELIKSWRTAMQNLSKTSNTSMSKLIGELSDYSSKVKKIQSEYNEAIKNIGNSNGTADDKKKATDIATAKRDMKLKELEPETIRFYQAVETLNKQAARNVGNELISAYEIAFKQGIISAEEYSSKVSEIMGKLNDRGNGKRSLFDRMSGLFFDRRNNQSQILGASTANNNFLDRLYRMPSTDATKAEISIRERLATALNNSYLGLGGLKERRIASMGNYLVSNMGNVSAWQNIINDPNASAKEKREAEKNLQKYAKTSERWTKYTKDNDGSNKSENALERLQNAAGKAADALSDMSKLASSASGMFQSFGNKKMAGIMSDTSNIIGAGADIASGIASGNPAAIISGAFNLVSSINAAHDNALKRQIELLEENNAALEANTKVIQSARARTLGYDTGSLLRQYSDEARGSMRVFYDSSKKFSENPFTYQLYKVLSSSAKAQKSGYQQELDNLTSMRDNYYSILGKQEDMKNKSESDILSTKQKIAELDEQIKFFAQDLAAELWSIDIKDWAAQISDALTTAFENGENAAEAYKDTVSNIMRQVANSMLKVGILEPMFQNLQNSLFGANGIFDITDPHGSMGKVVAYLGQFFSPSGEGSQTINAAMAFLEGFEDVVGQYGHTIKSSESNKLSSSIQGTSEETSDLLAAYVNALRQDVSIIRLFTEEFMREKFDDFKNSLVGNESHLANIDTNVAAIKALFDETGSLYQAITRIDTDLHSVIYGAQKIRI